MVVVARFIGLTRDFQVNPHEPRLTKGHENQISKIKMTEKNSKLRNAKR